MKYIEQFFRNQDNELLSIIGAYVVAFLLIVAMQLGLWWQEFRSRK